jgi:[glutamine synthetase] adenylyltransferase / [glutamine synthetase]-adenylyl-L-tyrosine phosphorylase
MTDFKPQAASEGDPSAARLPDPTPLLLAPGLSSQAVAKILQAYGLQDWKRADHNLQSMAGEPVTRKALAAILPSVLRSVACTADPDQAINEWERYVDSGIQRLQLFQYLAMVPHVVHVLGATFGNSPAMAQTFIRDPLLVYWIEDDGVLRRRMTRSALESHVQAALSAVTSFEAQCEALRRMKRREMLRIGIRDLLGIAKPVETYTVLSDLASAVIQAAYTLVNEELHKRFGLFAGETSTGSSLDGFCVLAMGKLGGWELNYSSDVDLIYVYHAPEGETKAERGQTSIARALYCATLAKELTAVLTAPTAEGALFRVDLRLRPEGMVGPLASSLDDALHYYAGRGRTWERLAFLKAKPIAGNLRVGQSLIKGLTNFVYGNEKEEDQVFPAIHSLRSKILAKIIQRGEVDRHVKLGIGGIREIEFIVQALQLRWGQAFPQIRDRQTLKALVKLTHIEKLTEKEARLLKDSYVFLRNLEHKLQMVHEFQTHLLPSKTEEMAKCAVRMGYLKTVTVAQATETFLTDYRRHTTIVHQLYERIMGSSSL